MDRIGGDLPTFILKSISTSISSAYGGLSGTFSLSVTTKVSIKDKASLKQMEAHPSVWLLKKDSTGLLYLFSMRAI